MPARLLAVPASHPSAAVERAFALKGVPLLRTDLLPGLSVPFALARYGGATVPAVTFEDGERVQGSWDIVRALEARVPDPPLVRADADRAERWGEEVLQPLARRLVFAALRARPRDLASYLEGARLPFPLPAFAVRVLGPLTVRGEVAVRGAGETDARADLLALPGHLDRVDAWIADGTLGAAAPSSADLQIGSSLRLLRTLEDLAGELDGRPAGALARRWFPRQPGRVGVGALPVVARAEAWAV